MITDENGMDQYIKTPTLLQCTDEGMANELSLLCPGDHYHLPLEAVHLEMATALLLLQFIKEFSAATSFRKLSTSSSTRSMSQP